MKKRKAKSKTVVQKIKKKENDIKNSSDELEWEIVEANPNDTLNLEDKNMPILNIKIESTNNNDEHKSQKKISQEEIIERKRKRLETQSKIRNYSVSLVFHIFYYQNINKIIDSKDYINESKKIIKKSLKKSKISIEGLLKWLNNNKNILDKFHLRKTSPRERTKIKSDIYCSRTKELAENIKSKTKKETRANKKLNDTADYVKTKENDKNIDNKRTKKSVEKKSKFSINNCPNTKEAGNFPTIHNLNLSNSLKIISIFRFYNYKSRLVVSLTPCIKNTKSKHKQRKSTSFNDKNSNNRYVVSPEKARQDIKNDILRFNSMEWCEIFSEDLKKFIPITSDLEIINPANDHFTAECPAYVFSIDENGKLKDITYRYITNFNECKKNRLNHPLWLKMMKKFHYPKTSENILDDKNLKTELNLLQLPNTIGGFKNHPAYILEKQMLKFEAFNPCPPPILTTFKDLPVYSRQNVFTLQSKERWFIKRGRSIKTGENPIKTVTRKTISRREKTLELYGKWQTEKYNPGEVIDGNLPKNEFGNIELYKSWMLPKGSVHIFLKNAAKIARMANIDYAPAVCSWEYGLHPHPLINGVIIAKENTRRLLKKYIKESKKLEDLEIKKNVAKSLKLWKKMIQSLLIKEHIDKNYFQSIEEN